jgi:hypothetical protein
MLPHASCAAALAQGGKVFTSSAESGFKFQLDSVFEVGHNDYVSSQFHVNNGFSQNDYFHSTFPYAEGSVLQLFLPGFSQTNQSISILNLQGQSAPLFGGKDTCRDSTLFLKNIQEIPSFYYMYFNISGVFQLPHEGVPTDNYLMNVSIMSATKMQRNAYYCRGMHTTLRLGKKGHKERALTGRVLG